MGPESFELPQEEVKKLLSALKNAKTSAAQEWVSNVISYLCRTNGNNHIDFLNILATNRKVLGPQGLKSLISFLKSEVTTVQTWALCAIGNLCIDSGILLWIGVLIFISGKSRSCQLSWCYSQNDRISTFGKCGFIALVM